MFYYTFPLIHTKYKPHFWVLHFTRHFREVLMLQSLSNMQLFPVISNSMQLLKEFYFDLVNITVHLVLWASKVSEQISKRPPGWQLDCSIPSVKHSFNLEVRLQTCYNYNIVLLRRVFCFSHASCGGLFAIFHSNDKSQT